MDQNKDNVTLVAPDGATDITIGGVNYAVKGGEVTIPREVVHHAYAFGYTNKPLDTAAIEAEADRVRAAQADMDAANAAAEAEAGEKFASEGEALAAFLARDAAAVIADLGGLPDVALTEAEAAEINGQAREDVVAAIEAERVRRTATAAG